VIGLESLSLNGNVCAEPAHCTEYKQPRDIQHTKLKICGC